MSGGRTILTVLQESEQRLQRSGSETARLDAQVLLAHALSTDRISLYTNYAKPLSAEEIAAFTRLLERRERGEPVAYLRGLKEFWSLCFRVDRRVLIPRPDTETVIEEAVERFGAHPPASFVDVGCGSGAIACALAHQFPESRGIAIELDGEAHSVATENVRALDLGAHLEVLQGDLLAPLGARCVDLICANLPYIPTAVLLTLPRGIRDFEPVRALDGGADGLEVIRALLGQAPARLNPRGYLVLEIGDDQAEAVCQLCGEAGLGSVRTRKDLAGKLRVVSAQA